MLVLGRLRNPDLWPALWVLAVPIVLFAASLQTHVGNWDTAEFQVVTYILGIPHPTGFPLYVLLGYVASHIPIGPITARAAAFSAVCATLTAFLAYVAARRLGALVWPAAFCATAFATGSTVWTTATRADVHTLAVLFEACAFAAMLAWYRHGDRRLLFVAAAAFGLGLATHPIVLFVLPALLVLAMARRERIDLRTALLACATSLSCLLFYLYLPLRSAYIDRHHIAPNTALGLSDGYPFWNYGDPSTLHGFIRMVSGSDFSKSGALFYVFDVNGLPMRLFELGSMLLTQYAWVFCVLALGGLAMLYRKTPVEATALTLFALLPALFGLGYGAEAFPERYFMSTYWSLAVSAAAGFTAFLRLIPNVSVRKWLPVALLWPIFGLLVIHIDRFGNHGDGMYEVSRAAVLASTPPNAIVIVPWLRGTSLAYGFLVSHEFGKRTLVVGTPEAYAGHLRDWLATRPVYAMDVGRPYALDGFRIQDPYGEPHIVRITPP